MSESNTTILESDTARTTLSFADVMSRVAEDYGKPLTTQLKELATLCMRGNRLTTEEYYLMRLYDDAQNTLEDKKRFVGLAKSREIWADLNEINQWTGVIGDKLAFEHMMRGFGIAVPRTLAVTGEDRSFPKPANLTDIASFKSFFEAVSLPVFGKPLDSQGSLGIVKLTAYDPTSGMLTLHNGKTVDIQAFWDEISTHHTKGYLLQDCLRAHENLTKLCGSGLPTVRILTLDTGNGPEIHSAAAKLTGGDNIADNFWRGGNLIAPVQIKTGTMGKALTGMGIEATQCSVHPDTGEKIEGATLPQWDQAVKLTLQAANIVKDAVIIGFDIALTDVGPVIIEANWDPHLIMQQVAHNKGMMDERMEKAVAYVKGRMRKEVQDTRQFLKDERKANSEAMRQALAKKSA